MIDYSLILMYSFKGSTYCINNSYDYNSLQWFSANKKPTKEELDSLWEESKSLSKKNNCKTQAKTLISLSDWSVLPDVKLENKFEFENYRNILRNFIINPMENPEFPTEPEPIWSN